MKTIQQHTVPVTQLAAELDSDLKLGLSHAEALKRLQTNGPNIIQTKRKENLFHLLLTQFNNPMVYLLGFAALVSVWFEEYMDAAAIFLVIGINVVIGFWMELQAEQSMDALKGMTSVATKIIRDGVLTEIPSEEIVQGDVLFFEAGDMVTADARIIQATQLTVNESALTGESMPVEKNTAELDETTALADLTNMLFNGTFISTGNARAIATATGMHTELGKIAYLVKISKKSAIPLEKKLQQFTQRFIYISLVIVVLVFIAGMVTNGNSVELLKTAIALAVAAIPEGMPVVATLALAQGMLKMARHKVIVKKLAAVETLGGTTVICTDKTGTLTENKILLDSVKLADGHSQENHKLLMHIGVLCNNARIITNGDQIREIGDPLEAGLLQYAITHDCCKEDLDSLYPKISELPFSSDTKVMATLHRSSNGFLVYAKGAPEQLLDIATHILNNGSAVPMSDSVRNSWIDKASSLSSSGMKVLAGAYKQSSHADTDFLSNLTFAGLYCFIDPIAGGVSKAIHTAHEAGIRVIMITGDHAATAANIAAQLNIIQDNERPLTGAEMPAYEHLTSHDKKLWMNTKVFARVTPAQKLDLVTILQEAGHIVGMTGDGVNDAPALKKADIGIAMGRRGTQVAREAADMVLTDDHFSSIVYAIRQGRTIFSNIQKFVIYLLSGNMSELFVIAVVALAGFQFQLVPLQILFINLITDVLPALALGVSRGDVIIMKHKPRQPDAPLLSRAQWRSVWVYATVISVCTLLPVLVLHYYPLANHPPDGKVYNNLLFFTIILSQLLHVFNMTSGSTPLRHSEIVRNKYVWYAIIACLMLTAALFFIPQVRLVLRITQLHTTEWIAILSAALSSVFIIRLFKRTGIIHD